MLFPYKPENHLSLIAKLHHKIIPWSSIAQLGEQRIFEVYKNLSKLESTFGYVWIEDKDELVGFTLATTDSKSARKVMSSTFTLIDIIKMFFYSFKSPRNFLNIIDSILFIPPFIKRSGTNAEWICWFTDTSEKKYSIAAIQMFFAIKKHYAKLGIQCFVAQGDKRTESHIFIEQLKGFQKKTFLQNYMYILRS